VKNRCLGCTEKIGSDELVMRAVDNVFHLKCFICVVCGVRLQKGDQYVVKQSQLFCRPDYEKEVEMLQGYNYGMSDYFTLIIKVYFFLSPYRYLSDDYCCEDIYHTRVDGRRGPKRPRLKKWLWQFFTIHLFIIISSFSERFSPHNKDVLLKPLSTYRQSHVGKCVKD
jgi:LIM homeobox transcription factor 1